MEDMWDLCNQLLPPLEDRRLRADKNQIFYWESDKKRFVFHDFMSLEMLLKQTTFFFEHFKTLKKDPFNEKETLSEYH